MLQLGTVGRAQQDQSVLKIPGEKKIYLEKDRERKGGGREKVLIICIIGVNTLGKYNLSKRKLCVHLQFGKTRYQKSMKRE